MKTIGVFHLAQKQQLTLCIFFAGNMSVGGVGGVADVDGASLKRPNGKRPQVLYAPVVLSW